MGKVERVDKVDKVDKVARIGQASMGMVFMLEIDPCFQTYSTNHNNI